MPNAETKILQSLGKNELGRFYATIENKAEAKTEWRPFDRKKYPDISSPVLDLAIGPFSVESIQQFITEYRSMANSTNGRNLLEKSLEFHNDNLNCCLGVSQFLKLQRTFNGVNFLSNQNPRCFLAIEIEKREDRKVVLSDIVNTSALGYVGMIVARTDRVLSIFVRLLAYLAYLEEVGKPTFKTSNIVVLSEKQFKDLIEMTR